MNPTTEVSPRQSRVSNAARTDPPKTTLGYKFDPVPRAAFEASKAKKILSGDIEVLAALLRFRSRLKFACWCTNRTIASKVGCSVRTIQRAIIRLSKAGLIAQEDLGGSDPDDPRNRTGWRIVFLWLAPAGYVPRKAPVREVPTPNEAASKGDTGVTPPMTRVSPPPMTRVSPNNACASKCPDGIEPDRTNPPSSSEREASKANDDDQASLVGGEGNGEQFEEAIAAAEVCYGPEHVERIRRFATRIGADIGHRWDCYAAAIYTSKARRQTPDDLWGYLRTVARDFVLNGISPNAEVARAKIEKQTRERAEYEARLKAEEAEEAKAKAKADVALEGIGTATAQELINQFMALGWYLNLITVDGVVKVKPVQSAPAVAMFPPAYGDRLRAIRHEVIAVLESRERRTLEIQGARFADVDAEAMIERLEGFGWVAVVCGESVEWKRGQSATGFPHNSLWARAKLLSAEIAVILKARPLAEPDSPAEPGTDTQVIEGKIAAAAASIARNRGALDAATSDAVRRVCDLTIAAQEKRLGELRAELVKAKEVR